MIALHFLEREREIYNKNMHKPSQIHQRESFITIQIKGTTTTTTTETSQATTNFTTTTTTTKPNFSAMKLFNRFRKILMRLIFSFPSRGSSGSSSSSNMAANSKQKTCDRSYDPPKTSCSSYYSSQSHYSEAIADCIEFFNKSSQEGILDGRKSDVMV